MTRALSSSPFATSAQTGVAGLEAVSKRFGKTLALDSLSLEVHPSELLALLGPNGAGKSTVISLLSGLRRPDSGTVYLFEQDPQEPAARVGLGVTPQETSLPSELRVREVLMLVGAYYPKPKLMQELLEQFGLGGLENRQCGGLSGGQKRRLAVALAFIGNPKLVILDEPTTGLDVEARKGLWEGIQRYRAGGGTVLLTTHYLEEAEALASRVAVIDKGQLIAEGTVAEIKARVGLKRVRFSGGEIPKLEGISHYERENGSVTLYTTDSDAAVRQLVKLNIPFSDLEVQPVSLEQAFVALTERNAEGTEQRAES